MQLGAFVGVSHTGDAAAAVQKDQGGLRAFVRHTQVFVYVS
jgi:hypothetical protein